MILLVTKNIFVCFIKIYSTIKDVKILHRKRETKHLMVRVCLIKNDIAFK
ncbi:hypothetical protein Hanom_Chr12g01064971 [Helianthus anomalus]